MCLIQIYLFVSPCEHIPALSMLSLSPLRNILRIQDSSKSIFVTTPWFLLYSYENVAQSQILEYQYIISKLDSFLKLIYIMIFFPLQDAKMDLHRTYLEVINKEYVEFYSIMRPQYKVPINITINVLRYVRLFNSQKMLVIILLDCIRPFIFFL